MKVAIISQYYPPENVHITANVARGLAQRGHQVRIITGYPNYPEGQLFDGYVQRWRSREFDGDIEILRVPLWMDHSQRAFRRALNYGSFALSAATARDFVSGADVIYVYATQMTPAFGPWIWRLVGGAPYVLHIQDLWPDSIIGSSLVSGGRSAWVIDRVLDPWISSVYHRAGAVIGIAPTMIRILEERGADPATLHLVYNWAEEPKAEPSRQHPASSVAMTTVLYGGNVGDMQDLETAVRAAHAAADAQIRLQIVGDGIALTRVKAVVGRLGATNVEFGGPVARSDMAYYYAQTDYALVTLKDLPIFRGTVPSKLQSALAFGLPVITTVQGDVRSLVNDLQVGYTADAENVDALEQAFRAAAGAAHNVRLAMADRARDAYADRFSQAAGIDAIARILERTVRRHRPRIERESSAVD